MDQGSGAEAPHRPALLSTDGAQHIGYVPAGVLIWGGLGLLLDRWLDLSFLTPLGLVLGWVLGSYLTYVRVVRVPAAESDQAPPGIHTDVKREGKSV